MFQGPAKSLTTSDFNHGLLGIDAEHLYFQFLFAEQCAEKAAYILDIERRHPQNKDKPISLQTLSLQVDTVIPHLLKNKWEPAAQAAMLLLLRARHGEYNVEQGYKRAIGTWEQRLKQHWRERASRAGVLADMTPRYLEKMSEYPGPADADEWIAAKSRDYVNAVMNFMSQDTMGRDVLEFGCGTGRITVELARVARRLTCVDHSPEMMARNRKATTNDGTPIKRLTIFGHEYVCKKPHDVCVCSLVLIHTTGEAQFEASVKAICVSARVAFVFEDTSQRKTSEYTVLRTRDEIKHAFGVWGMRVERESTYDLVGDQIAFLKFVR